MQTFFGFAQQDQAPMFTFRCTLRPSPAATIALLNKTEENNTMYSYEAPAIHEEPTPGQCYCHLLAGHPHASMNDVCDTCKIDYEEWSDQINHGREVN